MANLDSINGMLLLYIVLIVLFCIVLFTYFFQRILTALALFLFLPTLYGGIGVVLGQLVFGHGSSLGFSTVIDFSATRPELFLTLPSAIFTGFIIGFVSPLIYVFAAVAILLWLAKAGHVPQPIFESSISGNIGDMGGMFDRIIGYTRPNYGWGCLGLPLLTLTLASPVGGVIAGYGINQQVIFDPEHIMSQVGMYSSAILAFAGAILGIIHAARADKADASGRISITILALTFGAAAFLTAEPIANYYRYSLGPIATLSITAGAMLAGAIIGVIIGNNAKY